METVAMATATEVFHKLGEAFIQLASHTMNSVRCDKCRKFMDENTLVQKI